MRYRSERTVCLSERFDDADAGVFGTCAALSRGTVLFLITFLLLSHIHGQAADSAASVVFNPLRVAKLSPRIPGDVVAVPKREGDICKEGEVLLQLDETPYRLVIERYRTDLAQAQARLAALETAFAHRVDQEQVAQAEARLELARTRLQAKEKLFETKNLSEAEVQAARTDVAIGVSQLAVAKKNIVSTEAVHPFRVADAKAEIARIRVNLKAAEADVEACTIHAPFDGRVRVLATEMSESLKPGVPVIELIDDKTLVAEYLIPANLFPQLRRGTRVVIQVDQTASSVEGPLEEIAPEANPISNRIRVGVHVQNAEGTLRAGMTGRVAIPVKQNDSQHKPGDSNGG